MRARFSSLTVPTSTSETAQPLLRIHARLFLLGSCLLALAGCTHILPGLNLNPHAERGQYHIVKNASGIYEVLPNNPDSNLPPYRMLPITADLIAAEARADPADINTHLPALQPGAVPPAYRIGPGDSLNISVWDHPELMPPAGALGTDPALIGQLVATDGTMFYPYVGTFKVAGMTSVQIQAYLTDHLKSYIRNPQVGVRVISYQADRVEVTGEVTKPGTITLDNTAKGVLQAIDLAGGLTGTASRRRVILIRHGIRYDLDLAGLLSGDRVVPNPMLMPGDSIHVPDQSGDEVFMLGAVTTQLPIIIQQNSLSLLNALTKAGGLDVKTANSAGVLVFRLSDKPSTPAFIFTLDLSKASSVFLASQFQLQPRDVVYVKATDFAQYNAVIAQFLPTLTAIFQARQLTRP